MKKTFAIIGAFLLLLTSFLFLDKKQENLKEETLWRENPDIITYRFSTNVKDAESKTIGDELNFIRYANTLGNIPFFMINTIDNETKKNISYECGYHCKNLFNEISILKIFSAAYAEDNYRKNLNIFPQYSPRLKVFKDKKILKELILGNESSDKSRRFFETEGKIYSSHAFIFNRFNESIHNFRERNIFSIGNSKIKTIEFISEDKSVIIKIDTIKLGDVEKNSYTRLTQKKFIFDPSLGDLLESNLKNFKIEKYPDEINGEGFLVANELVKAKEEKKILLTFSNKMNYIVKIFPPTNIKENKLRPIIRQINDMMESPAYIKEESIQSIEKIVEKISIANTKKELTSLDLTK